MRLTRFDTHVDTAIRVGWRKVVLRVCTVDGSGTSKVFEEALDTALRCTQVDQLRSVLDGQAADHVTTGLPPT